MKIYNPTDKSITVTIGGDEYTVEADSTLSNVPQKAAEYWVSALHNFLVVSEDVAVPVKKEKVEEKEAVKDAVEEFGVKTKDVKIVNEAEAKKIIKKVIKK